MKKRICPACKENKEYHLFTGLRKTCDKCRNKNVKPKKAPYTVDSQNIPPAESLL